MEPTRKLPDSEICRTEQVGPGRDSCWCLVDDPGDCSHAKRFGSTDAYFCFIDHEDYVNPD